MHLVFDISKSLSIISIENYDLRDEKEEKYRSAITVNKYKQLFKERFCFFPVPYNSLCYFNVTSLIERKAITISKIVFSKSGFSNCAIIFLERFPTFKKKFIVFVCAFTTVEYNFH